MFRRIADALNRREFSIPIVAGQLALGTWQGIYVLEPRQHPFPTGGCPYYVVNISWSSCSIRGSFSS